MPFAHLRAGRASEFDCSLCPFKFKMNMPCPRDFATFKECDSAVGGAKKALFQEWDEHLSNAHPIHWEREQEKEPDAARTEWFLQKQSGTKGQ